MFENVTWPQSAIYNITPDCGARIRCGADIEHHFVVEGKKNVWIQKRKEKVNQALLEYAELAQTRCCSS